MRQTRDHDSQDKAKIIYGNLIKAVYKQIFPFRNYRPMTKFLRDEYCKMNDDLVGCEIGVAYGVNSRSMFNILPIKKLYLVDPYGSYKDDTVHDFSKGEVVAKKRLKRFSDKTVFIRKTSEDAVDDVPDDLDFVYIDGNHDYEYVKKDIELYYPKVKKGGVIGGHDFCAYYSVPHAVIEFVNKHNIELQGGDIDWWIVKE